MNGTSLNTGGTPAYAISTRQASYEYDVKLKLIKCLQTVMPAKAGIQEKIISSSFLYWMPAFAGMTLFATFYTGKKA